MMKKNMLIAIIALAAIILFGGIATAIPTISEISIDGDSRISGTQLIVQRGDVINIFVRITALNGSEKNVEVEAFLDGFEYKRYESVSDSSDVFDMDVGDTETIRLQIKIPTDAEKDFYDLKIRVGTRRGSSNEELFRISLKGKRHEVNVREILIPSQVQAGRGLFANVKIENVGQKTEKDITIRFKIPSLKIEEFTNIDQLEADDSTTSEDIVALIPQCARPGKYEVIVDVEFDIHDKVTATSQIEVLGSDICEEATSGAQAGEKTVISVPGTQEVAQGSAVAFPIMIQNMGSKSKTYTISVSKAVDAFGESRIEPSNVIIVQPQRQETVFVYVKTNDNAQIGQKDFAVTITSGDEKKDVMLSANIVKSAASGSAMRALEIGLVLLVVILVIAGLVMGFNKLKPKEEEKSGEIGQTYY